MVQINQVQTQADFKKKNSSFIKTLARDLAFVHWFFSYISGFLSIHKSGILSAPISQW